MKSKQQTTIDSTVQAFMKRQKIPACSISIGKRGWLVYAKGYGRATPDAEATAQTVYRIGSLTKQFTATIMLMAADPRTQNPIDLDSSLKAFFPRQEKWAGISIRNLLNHTSGIPSYTAGKEFRYRQFRPVSNAALLRLVKSYKQSFAPGSEGYYSNSNYLLLAHILQDRTELTFAELLQRQIFAPLSMNTSGLISPAPPGAGIARGSINGSFTSRRTHPNWVLGAGDIQSNVLDLAKWNMALLNNRLLSAEVEKVMFTSGAKNPEPAVKGEKFAMGWMDISTSGTKRYYHQGYLHGFSSLNYLENPLSGAGRYITILCNANLVQRMPELALQLARMQ